MSFYGQSALGDTKNIHFQFDKIFTSRREMDLACLEGSDGIYQGRFVLVKYDNENKTFFGETLYGFTRLENVANNIIMYSDSLCSKPYIYTTYTTVVSPMPENYINYYIKETINEKDFYIKVSKAADVVSGKTYYQKTSSNALAVGLNTIIYKKNTTTKIFDGKFYICIGSDSNGYALWNLINDYNVYGTYLSNFSIDAFSYGEDFDYRGYDATVWQKIYTEGNGKFILIARLNGSIPSFEIKEDKPAELPVSAYIDSNSSPDLYQVYVPSHWGFRIKEAIGDMPSEQQISQKYYDENSQEIISRSINADIYLNLKQKDDNGNILNHNEYKIRDNSTKNEILINPTGMSGKKYRGNVETDTYELSVHLPTIGNMISDGYDLVYGENQINTQTGKITRPRDIEWYDGNNSSDLKTNGNSFIGGKTYNLSTLAGTLNTMHNKLGQIVCHLEEMPSQSQIDNLSFSYLYEIKGTLYRRGIKYKKISLNDYIYKIDKNAATHYNNSGITLYTYEGLDNSGNPIYQQATGSYDSTKTYYTKESWCKYDKDLNAATEFSTNKYYEKNGSTYVPSTDTSYHPNKDYYLKNINPSRYTEVLLTKYVPSEFYYQEGESFICDHNSPNPIDLHRNYYTITQPEEVKTFSAGYEPRTFYKLDNETQIFVRDDSSVPDILDERPYYDLTNVTKTPTGSCIFYQPGFFYYAKKDGTGSIRLCNEAVLTQELFRDYNFYIYTFSDIPKYGKDINGNIIEYYEQLDCLDVTNYLQNKNPNTTYYYIDNDGKRYIPYDILYQFIPNAYTTPRVYYTIAQPNQYAFSSLYLPGRYHEYDPETKNYIKAYGAFNSEAIYYALLPEHISLVLHPFYTAHKYYFQPDAVNLPDRYDIAIDDFMDENKQPFYTKTSFYVDSDESNNCPYGYEWNPQAPYIPPTVTLYAREEYPALVALDAAYPGDNGLASINGQLLQLHQEYDPFNDEIRNSTTFRGILNSARDILYQIKNLSPGRICYVNNFGQIESYDLGCEKLLITNSSGQISSISLSELKTKLESL